jgi:adenine-specific DNA-methyltransferase
MNPMSKQFDKLIVLLEELFQLDQPDLDFGLYRIMHAKSDEITKFLKQDLLPQVKEAFSHYKTADKAVLEKELTSVIAGIEAADMDPNESPKVKELRQKLTDESVDVAGLESEVYDHLYSFFRRYYHEGDFLPKRVYKPGVYAIPYEGEEVKLHWANQDQYYIKTNEYLRDYAFMLQPDNETDPMRVHFRLANAKEGEHGNVKAVESKERVFILLEEDFITEEDGELIIAFEYRAATKDDWSEEGFQSATAAAKKKPPAQKELLADAVRRVLSIDDPALKRWIDALSKKHVKVNRETADYTRLQGHLNRYSARNTFDYFIHKGLGGFLRRELDFYIKNEVMHLDDVENESVPRVEQYLSKIKVIRKVGHKLIDFLAQLENFQKKLWLKKKFVVETNYCITLDRIPEEFYPEIAVNEKQREEWVKLFAINKKIETDLAGGVAYSEPLSVDFLTQNNRLIIDTAHFFGEFKDRLIASIEGIDSQCTGLLIHSDNFQALQSLKSRYRGLVGCIHIDPPYNTQTSGFLYKNTYQHASWLAFMENRISSGIGYLKEDGDFLCHIDENEYERLHLLFEDAQISDSGTIIWDKRNPMLGGKGTATQHEYITWRSGRSIPVYVRNKNILSMLGAAQSIINKHGGVNDDVRRDFSRWVNNNKELSGGEKAYNRLEEDGRIYQSVGMAAPETRTNEKFFIPITHPITGKPCPAPVNGWSRAPETINELIKRNEIIFGVDETTQPRRKVYLTEESQRQMPSLIQDGRKGKNDMLALGLEFPYCHPVPLYEELIGASAQKPNDIVLDFFAGSGTTGHAVIALNVDDQLNRQYILVENGDHFDTVMLPRLKKVSYAVRWSNGQPATSKGSSQLIKYNRLEGYEDTLVNLIVKREIKQQNLLDSSQSNRAGGLKEEFILRYMLNSETEGSQSLLNISAFKDPTAYQLKVKCSGSDESREVNVDLLETFNYLIGLTVQHIAAPQIIKAAFNRDGEGRLRLDGRLKLEDSGPWWFRTVTGKLPDGRNALVIWRKLTIDSEQDNLVLDEWFTRQGYSTKDYEFDLIYVNGDSNLGNLRQPDETWKVRVIEEDFHRLMFETESI